MVKKVKKIFELYKILKFRNKYFSNIDNLFLENKYFIQYNLKPQKYIEIIENILINMDKENAEFLKAYFLENKKKEDFHYSSSTFYFKLNKAMSMFLDYMDN